MLKHLFVFPDKVLGSVYRGGGAADVIYLDFSEAFDTVSHGNLIRKLNKYSLDESIVR